MILEAGGRCDPPLFKDQPIENENVFYHLGFGLTSSPNIKDFGRSKWYLPPNCSKIRENAPSLCHHDDFCRKKFYQIIDKEKASSLIKASEKRDKKSLGEKILNNPLIYYIRRKRLS
jgi:DNA primase large subunit